MATKLQISTLFDFCRVLASLCLSRGREARLSGSALLPILIPIPLASRHASGLFAPGSLLLSSGGEHQRGATRRREQQQQQQQHFRRPHQAQPSSATSSAALCRALPSSRGLVRPIDLVRSRPRKRCTSRVEGSPRRKREDAGRRSSRRKASSAIVVDRRRGHRPRARAGLDPLPGRARRPPRRRALHGPPRPQRVRPHPRPGRGRAARRGPRGPLAGRQPRARAPARVARRGAALAGRLQAAGCGLARFRPRSRG